MIRGFVAGLLAVSALSASLPAMAQDGERRGGWGRNGTSESRPNPRAGGWQRPAEARPDRADRPDPGQWRRGQGDGNAPRWQGNDRPQVDKGDTRSAPVNVDRPGRAGDNRQARPDWDRSRRTDSQWRDRDWDRNRRIEDRRPDRSNNWDRRVDNRWQQHRDWNRGNRFDDRNRWSDVRRWDRDWRRDNRYDWMRHRDRYRHVYRLPSYRTPYGWNHGYRSFSVGIYLNSLLFADRYWIDDPWSYRLPPAYGPLRWIRYYDDALLVDIRDGYVVDVIYNFFW